MASVEFKCPHCQQLLEAPEGIKAGQTVACPACHRSITLRKVGEAAPVVVQSPLPRAGGPITPVCLSCGYQGPMHRKYPAWVIVCAILFFPIGLLFLCADKRHKCPQCGEMQRR